jgi:hypothetical protein
MRVQTKTLKLWEQYATKQGFYIGIATDFYIPIKSIRKAILNGECSEHIYEAINAHIEALKK